MTAPELTSRASAAGVLGRLSASRASAAYLVGGAAATGLYFLLPPDVQSVWVFLVDPWKHMGLAPGERLVDMAYPAMDVLLLVALAQLLVGAGRRTPAYRLLVVSVALWVLADEIYGLNVDAYQGGAWVDALW